MSLPVRQQNPYYVRPMAGWRENGNSISPTHFATAALRKRKRKEKNGTYVFFLGAFLLVLLALIGVGLGIYKILQLQKKLSQLQEFISDGDFTLAMEKESGRNTQSLLLDWNSKSMLAFTTGIEYKNKGLVVPLDGLYFVYTNVDFQQGSCESMHLRHQVLKKTQFYPNAIVLMENRQTSFCEDGSRRAHNSYLGAVFNLSKNDFLYVNVSSVALVFEESKTFFGLARL